MQRALTGRYIQLTETSRRVQNWDSERRTSFDSNKFYVFESQNYLLGQNDVTIAINKELFEVECVFFYPASGHKYPDNLEIDCVEKKTDKKFTIVGIRIHSSATDLEKREELSGIFDSVAEKERIILTGDFNNYRRGCVNNTWCLKELLAFSKSRGFSLYTPDGGSIYMDNNGDYSFPEDHILLRGDVIVEKLHDYDRGC